MSEKKFAAKVTFPHSAQMDSPSGGTRSGSVRAAGDGRVVKTGKTGGRWCCMNCFLQPSCGRNAGNTANFFSVNA
jgi:hypothetical protein